MMKITIENDQFTSIQSKEGESIETYIEILYGLMLCIGFQSDITNQYISKDGLI